MPQTLTNKWKEELGTEYEEIHSKYLHTIGNITLTGYNSKLSNKSFSEKRDMDKGFKDSRLYLNKYISTIDHWNEDEIIKRAEILFDRSLDIWPYPDFGYEQIETNNENTFSLSDEDINFTGESVVSFEIFKESYKVSNWKEFYEKLLNMLYDLDPIKLRDIARKSFGKDSIDNRKSTEVTKLRRPIKVADGIYMESNIDTEAKLFMMRFLMKQFDLSLDDVNFTIR